MAPCFCGGECRFQSLRFNLFVRGFGELPVKILKLTVIAWTDSSLQELHKFTIGPLLRSITFRNKNLSHDCMWVWAVVTFVALFWQKLTGPSSSGHMKHQEPRNRKALHQRCLCILKWSPCAATLILQRCSSNRWHLGIVLSGKAVYPGSVPGTNAEV